MTFWDFSSKSMALSRHQLRIIAQKKGDWMGRGSTDFGLPYFLDKAHEHGLCPLLTT